MNTIIDKLNAVPNLEHLSGCSAEQVTEAQKVLGLLFPEDYVRYVRAFGAVSFYATEWTGLNVKGYLNVVTATTRERESDPDFPKDAFVLENLAFEGRLVLMREDGRVYAYNHGDERVYDASLADYLDRCLQRR